MSANVDSIGYSAFYNCVKLKAIEIPKVLKAIPDNCFNGTRIQSFDIPRLVSVYPDRSGIRWWTKAWFNNSESGEAAIEIDRQLAIKFINENIEKDEWLEEYFPKQMEVYHNAIEQTREQILSQLNL